jgi:hypothetical protein
MMVNPSAHLVSIEETEEHLRLHWRFTALMPVEQARQRLQEYFARLGYTPVASENNTLIMQRGSGGHRHWTGRRAAKRRHSSPILPPRKAEQASP